MKHAGIHWPENAGGEHPNREAIASMPGMAGAALICSPSGRYHYDFLRKRNPSAVVVWRAIPRQGKLPAQLGWEPNKVADECLNLWDEQPHNGTEWFLPLNELQFEKENGGPFSGYGPMAENLRRLRLELRRRLPPTVKLMFPAWVPSDDMDRLGDWEGEARHWDTICLHAYGSAETMRARYDSYRAALPHHSIFVGEWNANHEGHDERAALQMWAEVADTDPLFLGAAYFIWETLNAGENDLSVWGNGARYGLFLNPPTVTRVPDPPVEPEIPTMPEPKTRDEVIAISNAVADEVGIPRLLLLACGIAESNLRWNARRPTSPDQDAAYWTDVSMGVWQQTVRWSQEYKDWYTNDVPGHPPGQFPGADVTEAAGIHYYDVDHAARVAATQLKGHYRPGEDDAIAKALARYNKPALDGAFASPAHEANYRRGIAEARTILGEPEQPSEPGAIQYEDYRDPQPAGSFAGTPRGIVLHGSRSGKIGNPQEAEYLGTASWEVNNPNGLGWNVTIADNRVALHIDPQQWGWHAKGASPYYLSVEFAQPTADRPVTDAQVDALADWIRTRVLPVWPDLPMHFPSHAEVQQSGETGDSGNTDVFPLGSSRMTDLRERLYARFQTGGPQPEPAEDLAQLQNLVGNAFHEDGVVVPALAAALANPDDANLRMQTDAVLRWLRSNNPDRAA